MLIEPPEKDRLEFKFYLFLNKIIYCFHWLMGTLVSGYDYEVRQRGDFDNPTGWD